MSDRHSEPIIIEIGSSQTVVGAGGIKNPKTPTPPRLCLPISPTPQKMNAGWRLGIA